MEKEEVFVPTELKMQATAKLAKEVEKELKKDDHQEKSIASLLNKDTDADSA